LMPVTMPFASCSAAVALMLIVTAAIPAKKIVAVLIGLLLAFDSRQQDATRHIVPGTIILLPGKRGGLTNRKRHADGVA
jgi:hypothetical protein